MSERDTSAVENSGQFLIPIKGLRLITPQKAIELGIETEGPTFVSRSTGSKQMCYHCGVEFSALVYDVGAVTSAQHLHDDNFKGGGIYYELVNRDRTDSVNIHKPGNIGSASIYGWLARLEPIGDRILYKDPFGQLEGRSLEAATLELLAICMSRDCKDRIIEEGIAALDSKWPGSLMSYHNQCVPEKEGLERVLEFKMVEGRPLFSQI